jgi:hypothetical protein
MEVMIIFIAALAAWVKDALFLSSKRHVVIKSDGMPNGLYIFLNVA